MGRLMWLVDTNIWLELLLEQEQAGEVREFLQGTPTRHLWMTDFSLYSIGIILMRMGKSSLWEDFVSDVVEGSETRLISLSSGDLKRIPGVGAPLGLDFDDAYQYVAAEKYGLTLVSLDTDFDRTPLG
ncbi:MAG: PIN domain-containing protein, partial [Anaerolineae bacterium]|nr:PIN domain-containing protein [Anaerolineae bacterium]